MAVVDYEKDILTNTEINGFPAFYVIDKENQDLYLMWSDTVNYALIRLDEYHAFPNNRTIWSAVFLQMLHLTHGKMDW